MKHKLAGRTLFIEMIPATALGDVWIAGSSRGLVALAMRSTRRKFTKQIASLTGINPSWDNTMLAAQAHRLKAYLEGHQRALNLPVDWSCIASPFQRRVLRQVLRIPTGETRSYQDIAKSIGNPRAARAVGRANATNPLPLVIPCHRVIGKDGRLTGYSGDGGIRTKAWLLESERHAIRKGKLKVPKNIRA